MGLLRSLGMRLLSIWLFCLLRVSRAQSPISSRTDARALDALLQDYAYRAFVRPRTGFVYDGTIPSNLSGITISAIRLRSGSLRTKGDRMFKEFEIPRGIREEPYVERLVLVYQNLGDWSKVYYPVSGYTYLAPVLGLLAYDASDLMGKNLPELDIRASVEPISIKFSNLKSVPDGSVLKCISFYLNGSENLSDVLTENICTTFLQGHFSIVVESIAPSANVSPTPAPPGGAPNHAPKTNGKGKKNNSKVWITVGPVIGGLTLLVLLGLLVSWLRKYRHRKRVQQMERAADIGEILHMTTVGSTKAPAATVTRTQPTIETEYLP